MRSYFCTGGEEAKLDQRNSGAAPKTVFLPIFHGMVWLRKVGKETLNFVLLMKTPGSFALLQYFQACGLCV